MGAPVKLFPWPSHHDKNYLARAVSASGSCWLVVLELHQARSLQSMTTVSGSGGRHRKQEWNACRTNRGRATFRFRRQMNPDALFDYLDGKLPEFERERLEAELLKDSHLQRQLAIAREIHRQMRGSREILLPTNEAAGVPNRGSVLGRRVAAAFAVLFLLNVMIGLAVIVWKNPKTASSSRRADPVREQVASSIGRIAESALPPPTLESGEIVIPAVAAERQAITDRVIAAAERCGGSTAKALPNDRSVTIIADIPAIREREFRQAVSSLTPLASTPANSPAASESSSPSSQRKIIQVRIGEVAAR